LPPRSVAPAFGCLQFDKIARFQYPQKCGDFVVSTDPGRFFGSLMHDSLVHAMGAAGNFRAVYQPAMVKGWFSSRGADWCSDSKWQWDCYFLPVTNCTVPDEVQEAITPEPSGWDSFKALKFVEGKLEAYEGEKIDQDCDTSPYNLNFAQAFMMRFNHRTRSRVAQLKAQVVAAPQVGEAGGLQNGECTAVHARRGDKLNPGDVFNPHNPAFWQVRRLSNGSRTAL
jgi:hypothetical protein